MVTRLAVREERAHGVSREVEWHRERACELATCCIETHHDRIRDRQLAADYDRSLRGISR
jgi:hypothetical protein